MRRVLVIASTLLASWLGMQAIHELGHVFASLATGGRVERVVLHPFTLSRTDLNLNPHPILVAWAGPLFGAIAPLALLGVAQKTMPREAFILRFVAGFCLIANGTYFGIGALAGIGDAADVLKHGGTAWPMLLFGAVTIPLGLRLWHGLGPAFSLGPHAQPISRRVLLGTTLWLAAQLAIGFGVGGE